MLKFWKKKNSDKDTGKAAPATDDPTDTRPPTPGAAPPTPAPLPEAPADNLDDIAADTPPAAPTPAPEREPSPANTPTTDTDTETSLHEDAPPPAADATPRGWRKRLAGSGFARGLSSLFSRHPKLDDDLLDELETVLITADVGVNTSMELVEDLRRRMHKREFVDSGALLDALREQLVGQLSGIERPLEVTTHHPFVLLVVGVNGVGKTTTIGKLAHRYGGEGLAVTLAAGDTFRAAAVEQLKTWGERNRVPVISQGQGADSASVIYDALAATRARGGDVLIADTAGRLHTQSGLMDELAKVIRVTRKLDPEAPHEVLMVIDGTTGQNAISQLRQFQQSAGVTGLVVTKLDGTAKGGVVFALAREFDLPIRFVGLGEGMSDLRPFDARAFVDGLLPAQLGGAEN